MTIRVSRDEVHVHVDFYGWALQEADDSLIPARYPSGKDDSKSRLVTPRSGRLDIASAGHTHTAFLAAEVWESEPPRDEGEKWDACEDARIFSHTGRLAVCVTTTKQLDRITLGRPETTWHARVYCTGRDEVFRLAQLDVPEGIERYLVQFWPAS